MRAAVVAASALAVLTIVSCGGGKDSSTELDANGRYTTSSTDGATVQYAGSDTPSSAPTTRVARDASGAPALPDGHVPAGSVYKFTPLGMGAANIEIRVPFDPSLTAGQEPKLLVSMPGEQWAEASQARIYGNTLVAQVPQLMYAVVTTDSTDTAPQSQATAQDVYKSGGASQANASAAPRLSVRVASSTAPQLPPPDQRGIIQLSQSTRLDLQLAYNLPTGCTSTPRVRAYAVFVPGTDGNNQIKTVELANAPVSTLSGAINVSQNLGASENGIWTFAALAYCTNPGQILPRYAYLATGSVIKVNVQATTAAPLITQAPQNASATEGSPASFSVVASGAGLAYQWQRSNNGGLDYANVSSATAASVSITTILADNASLWRVVVRNTSGAVTSTAASLTVVQRAVAPSVTSDPANQAVIEGETASFSSAASGTPAPSIQWQTRPSANADANAGWVNIAGATASTYSTSATTLAANARQYRAQFSNSAGSASSLPATLSVSARTIAPSITTQPIAQSVQAGQFGLFSVSAAGTSPLSYQWFKNGQALVAANATEVLIPANAADVGTSYQISVQVSNSAGSVNSAVVNMTITASTSGGTGTTGTTGTLVNAAQGGVITTGTGAEGEPSLVIPPGALSGNTTMTLVASSSSAIGLPAGATALGDVLEIGPSGLTFNSPITLNLPVPSDIPEGKVLAVIELSSSPALASQAKTTAKASPTQTAQSAFAGTNLQRLAKSRALGLGVMMMAADPSAPASTRCVGSQDIRGGSIKVDLSRAARYITAAVSPEGCDSNTTTIVKRALIPSTTTAPCTNDDWAKIPNGGVLLVSRHVQCGLYVSSDFDITGADNTDYGKFRWEVRVSSYGPANGLNKTFNFSSRLSRTAPAFADSPKPSTALPTLRYQPVLNCSSAQDSSAQCQFAAQSYSVNARSSVPASLNEGWTNGGNTSLNLSWSGGDGTFNEFSFSELFLYFAKPGNTINLNSTDYFGTTLGFSSLRCDKGVARPGTTGCVYPAAPAVLVLSTSDDRVQEAAQHIREAQQGPLSAPGGLSIDPVTNVATASTGNALQYTRIEAANESNRTASCRSLQSLFNTRPTSISASCQANPAGCQCDEYPFAATWNGGFFSPNSTSVKSIRGLQNTTAGGFSSGFYLTERVLDLTVYDGSPTATPYDLSQERSRAGDNFWVHIE